ncbi:MAG TPA: sigma-70 family RNA polymerase sigma factor [Planctomycetota bacterium]
MPLDVCDFERLCAEHRRAILSYAYLCGRDYNLAEDIVQDTLTIAFGKKDQYVPEADFRSWLISIARNVWFRERQRRRLSARSSAFIDEHASYLFEDAADEESSWEEESAALKACVGKLSPVDQGLIEAHFARNQKYAEIARLRDRTLAWVKVRMHRARIALLACVQLSVGGKGEVS